MTLDMRRTIVAKSDRLNAADIIGQQKTITITGVQITNEDQPVRLDYEGMKARPYYPCKTVRRILVALWGADANAYIGRSLTLYNDPDVIYAGEKTGGIRVSHATDISDIQKIALPISQKKKKIWTIEPLKRQAQTREDKGAETLNKMIEAVKGAANKEALEAVINKENFARWAGIFEQKRPELSQKLQIAIEQVRKGFEV